MMDVAVLGIGAWSTTQRSWPALVAACVDGTTPEPAAAQPTRPSPTLLPPAERRRAPDGVAVGLAVASEAVTMATVDPTSLATVFTSAHGDLAIVDYLCTTLATDPSALSPTRFHLSVHNAAAGNWSIATHDEAPSTALAGGDDSFALGLLEATTMAVAERRAVLLVAFDTPATGLLAHVVGNTALFGFAMIVAPVDAFASSSVCLSLAIETRATPMPTPRRDALRLLAASSPAARALALAEALAADENAELRYPIGPATTLSVAVRQNETPNRLRPDEAIE